MNSTFKLNTHGFFQKSLGAGSSNYSDDRNFSDFSIEPVPAPLDWLRTFPGVKHSDDVDVRRAVTNLDRRKRQIEQAERQQRAKQRFSY